MFAILGSTGKIGKATIQFLRKSGKSIRAIVRTSSKSDELLQMGCEICVADLNDITSLVNAFQGAEAVQVICPPNPRTEQPLAEMGRITDNLLIALQKTNPRMVLAISDYGAHLESKTGITLAFNYLESCLKKLDTSVIFLRSAEHMENWQRSVPYALKTNQLPSMHHPLSKKFPSVSAPDVGIAAAELLLNRDISTHVHIVHIEGPKRYTAVDIASAFQILVDREVLPQELPRADWVSILTKGGSSQSYAQLVAELYDTHNAGLIDFEKNVGNVIYGKTDIETAFLRLKATL
jgi:NAD(P)H dehydrogenase (quinone)